MKLQSNLKLSSLILLFLMLSSCGKLQNSSTNDANLYGSGVTGTTNFLSARAVLANKCFSCHGTWSSYSEAEFVTAGLVLNGIPNSSSLYTRIRGNDSGTAGDMPVSGANLTNEDLSYIKTWISGI